MSNKKVMISLNEQVLSDLDSISAKLSLSRSAFIRYLLYNYNDTSHIIVEYEMKIYALQQQLSHLKDTK